MPEEKKPLSGALSSANAALEQTNAIIRQIEAIKAAAGGGKAELVVTTKVQGTEEAASAVEKSSARQVTALGKIKAEAVAAGQAVDQVSRPRTTARAAAPVSRIDRTTSQAFIEENKRAIDLLNRTSREPDAEVRQKQYKRYGLSTNLAEEAEKLRIKREQLDSVKRLRDAASSGDDEELVDAIHTYNKTADPDHKYDPRLNAAELDLRAGNEIGSLGRQVADRQRALAYRVARDRGAIRDKSNLTNPEVRARIQQMIKVVGTEPAEGGIADVDALARSFITVHRGDVPGYIQAQIKAGDLPIYEKLDTRTGAQILADIQEKYKVSHQAGRADYLTSVRVGQGESPLGGTTVARGRAYQELLRPIRAKQAAEAKAAARAQRDEDKVAAEKAKQEMLQEPGYVPAEEEVPAEPAPELPVRLRGIAKLNALRAKLVQRYPNIFGILGNRKGFVINPFAPREAGQGELFPSSVQSQVQQVGPQQFEVTGYRAQPAFPSQPSLVEMQKGITASMLSDEALSKFSKQLDPLFFPAALRGLQRGTVSQTDLRDLFQIGGERSANIIRSLEGAGFTSGVQGPRGQEFIATRGDLVAFKMELERATVATHGFGDAAINTARTAAGLPNAPPVVGGAGIPPGGAGRGFYMPGRGLYGPGSFATGTGGTAPGTGFYMPGRGLYGPRVILPVAAPINARLPGDWLGGGGAPPVGYGGVTAVGFGGGGAGGGAGGGGAGDGGAGGGGLFGALGGRFKSLALYTVAASVIYPIMAGIRQSLNDAAELEVVLKRIQGIYGSHTLGEQLTIKKEIIGTAIQFSANLLETARTAQLLAQEQIPIEKLSQNLKAIAQGAVGLGISQEALANYVISIRNVTAPDVKPLEGPELVNLISAFVRRGAVSSQNLLTSIQQIVPILETFSPNQSPINDPALIASITSVIARRSSFTGAQVANTIKYMISRFGNPDVVRDIEQRAQIGLGTKESGGQELRPFIEILQDLSNAYQHLIDTGQGAAAQNLLKDLFGARQAGVGEILLTNFKTAITEADTAMKDYGASAELASGQQDTFNKSMERLKTVFTSKFAAPAQENLFTPFIKGLADDLEELSDQFDDVVAKFGQFLIFMDELKKKTSGPEGVDLGRSLLLPGASAVPTETKPKHPRPPLPVNKRPGYQGNLALLLGGQQASLAQNLAILTGGEEIKDQVPSTPGVNLYSDKEFKDFYNNFYVKRVQLLAGQQQAALDFGASFSSSKRNVSELTNELERFYQAIHIGERKAGESFEDFVKRVTGKDTATAKQMIQTHNELVQDLGKAYEAEKRRLAGVSIITQAGRLEESTARAQDQTDRIRRRLVRTYGRRGLDQYPIQVVQNELEDIARSRIFDIQRENAAYQLRVTLLQKSPEFREKARDLQQAELDDLLREHQTNLDILDVQSRELSIQAEINGLYESRLKDLNEIEKVSNDINSILQQSIAGLPGQSRATGFFGRALSSILVPASSSLFRTLVNQIKFTGQGGLFPGIGAALAKVVGAPSNLKTVEVPLVGRAKNIEGIRAEALSSVATLAGVVGGGRKTETKEVQKSAEQLRKEQRDAAIRALIIAGSATLGAAAGKGGVGAQTGSQLGAIGGYAALGGKLGIFGGPLGAIAGGLIGGLFGGLFDKKKPKPPELVALEKIAANTGESVTLLENTNRLLELQSIAFNVPTGFTLPRFQPTVFGGSSLTGGQVPVTTNLNINVSVDGAAGSPQQLGAIIAQAVSDRLESEYSSGGRYVARSGY